MAPPLNYFHFSDYMATLGGYSNPFTAVYMPPDMGAVTVSTNVECLVLSKSFCVRNLI